MKAFPKPRVVVSQCLEFDSCRYNGALIPDQFVRKLNRHVEFIKVCPELEIGLGVPRDPIKLIEEKKDIQLVQPSKKRNLTQKMKKFSFNFLGSLEDIDGFILKFGSPSCGINNVKIFHKMDNPIAKRKGSGMFAQAVLDNFGDCAIEDEGRLTNFRIREHFLTKIFLFARFRKVKRDNKVSTLVKFQTENKMLLMAYSQKHLKFLGKVVAKVKNLGISQALHEYEDALKEAFKKNARHSSHINVLMHSLGYFKNEIESKEKRLFLRLLEKYKNETLPLSALLSVMQSWIVKYDKDYLQQQTYFEPFPEELVEMTDSGKGRKSN